MALKRVRLIFSLGLPGACYFVVIVLPSYLRWSFESLPLSLLQFAWIVMPFGRVSPSSARHTASFCPPRAKSIEIKGEKGHTLFSSAYRVANSVFGLGCGEDSPFIHTSISLGHRARRLSPRPVIKNCHCQPTRPRPRPTSRPLIFYDFISCKDKQSGNNVYWL